jgi:hypothetical protein
MAEYWSGNGERSARANGGPRGVWKRVSTTLRARARLRRQQKARARTQRLRYVTPEQLAYADVLEIGLNLGRFLLAVTFLLYVFSITTPKVPLSDLTTNWTLSAEQYSSLVGVGAGWGWINLVHYGDYMNFLGIALLASVTAACYLRMLPVFFRSKDYTSSVILLLEILVLFLAASGLLALGH